MTSREGTRRRYLERTMIVFDNVSLTLSSGRAEFIVLSQTSVTLPTNDRLIVLGQEGSGKTALIRLLSGLIQPTDGKITRYSRVSFPIGFMGAYKRKLTAYQNIAHVADLYGADVDEVINFVALVTGLGHSLNDRFGDLAPQHRNRLAFATSYAIPFDVYLIDSKFAAGDDEFRLACRRMLEARAETSGIILATHRTRYARRYGGRGAILHKGRLVIYDDVDEAIWTFHHLPNSLPTGRTVATGRSAHHDA